MIRSREIELERLRIKILDAVRESKRFWITFREGTFGIASILNLIYKKSFMEILFFTNSDVIEKGVPLLKIYTPLENEIDFSDIIVEPDFDDDGLISPSKIINRMRSIMRREFQNRLAILDRELQLLEERFESYQVEKNPYQRDVRISFPDFALNLNINFEKYPLIPSFEFSEALARIISEKVFGVDDLFVRHWNILEPPHVYEIVEKLIELIVEKVKIEPLQENSQFLLLENVSIEDGIRDLSIKLLKGKSLGIIYEQQIGLLELFEAIAGNNDDFKGKITIFGEDVRSASNSDLKRIFIIPEAYDAKIQKMNIIKGIKYGINIKEHIAKKGEVIRQIIRNAEMAPKLDETLGNLLIKSPKILKKEKRYLKNALEVTGLWNKRKKKFSKLTPLEFLLFSIGRALLQDPAIIMFSIPFFILDPLDYEKFNGYMDSIKRVFNVALIINGPKGIVSNCNQILTISEEKLKVGSFDELIHELPQEGDIITIELNAPDEELVRKIYGFNEADTIIEERKNEKYKVYLKENPNELIIRLIKIFGPSLYSFKRSRATLDDYIEFVESKNV